MDSPSEQRVPGFRLPGPALHILAVCFGIFVVGCASAPPAKAPEWTTMPPAVLDAFCGKLQMEAMISRDVPVTIVSTTQPIVSGAALRSLAHVYGKDAELSSLGQLINASLQPMPVDTAGSRACTWSPVPKLQGDRFHDIMVVELSAPFLNPFARRESGLFARYSLGGHDAQWYWIPLAERNGIWAIGTIMATDMHE